MKTKVLVLDSSERAALAIIRSLGSKMVEVIAGDSKRANMGFLSRYCSRRVLYPDPVKNKVGFIKSLLSIVKKGNFEAVFPVTDYTTFALSEYKEEFAKYTNVAAPDYEKAINVIDKATTVKIASKYGIPYPKTVIPEDVSDVKEVAKSINYPVVIKPRIKPFWVNNKAIILNVSYDNYAFNEGDLLSKFNRFLLRLRRAGINNYPLPLIQERVRGRGGGVEVLIWNSRLKALFMHRRLREFPTTGGASTYRESFWDEKLARSAIKLMYALSWEGVAMVEFKLTENGFKLMEVNGRFWGSLPLAINAGIDFPYLLLKCMIEGDCEPTFSYKLGLRQKWLIYGDLAWLVAKMIYDKEPAKALSEVVKSLYSADDVISVKDLRPVVGALKSTLDVLVEYLQGKITLSGENV